MDHRLASSLLQDPPLSPPALCLESLSKLDLTLLAVPSSLPPYTHTHGWPGGWLAQNWISPQRTDF